ncbi:MAG: hypothetical protein QNJ60_19230 [Xenococcaceae cyanobacterium MO_188.B19]|nr:hypothetical protein [Xenococcaceae cyanobacterium MO_188.B19]
MIRKLISIITAFASFIGLVLIGNNAMANPVENSTVTQESYTKVVKVVNLNVSSPFLELNNKTPISMLEHLGCSCGMCTQRTNNLESKI